MFSWKCAWQKKQLLAVYPIIYDNTAVLWDAEIISPNYLLVDWSLFSVSRLLSVHQWLFLYLVCYPKDETVKPTGLSQAW